MKKIFTLLVIALTIKEDEANFQKILFENLNNDGTVSNWGNMYLFPMWIDTDGTSYVDSIVFDNYWFYIPTTDALLGNTAMELSNAWDFTTNQGIAGSMTADTDSVFSSWSSFEVFPIQSQPFNFSFFYKYFPVNNDTGVATLQLFDSSMNQVGEAVIFISGTVSNYTLATTPVTYSAPEMPAFAYINFRTAVYGSQASFGTRLLIDGVMFNYVTIGIRDPYLKDAIKIYPNPFTDEISVNDYTLAENEKRVIEVFDVYGRTVYSGYMFAEEATLETNTWQSGIYFVRMKDKAFKIVKN
jgi:hypothetical protein